MMQKKLQTLIRVALLTASAVVLRIFAVTLITQNRLIFHNIPLILAGLLYGPWYGMVAGLFTDLSSLLYQPNWDPLWIPATMLWGFIPGLFRPWLKTWSVKKLLVVETISHLFVSLFNTLIMGVLYGWNVALGKITTKEYVFMVSIFEHEFPLIRIGNFIYLRLIFVVVLMLIKIPLDTFILHQITKKGKHIVQASTLPTN
jgi:ECF transporter S component (folate family)